MIKGPIQAMGPFKLFLSYENGIMLILKNGRNIKNFIISDYSNFNTNFNYRIFILKININKKYCD
jgi:hypothetical protein